jgi:hypothetical protein
MRDGHLVSITDNFPALKRIKIHRFTTPAVLCTDSEGKVIRDL